MPTSDFDRDVESTPARIKEDIRRIMILFGSVIGAFAFGYILPHPPRTVEKIVYRTKEIASCPDGPFTVQKANVWVFYKEKTTGCIYVESKTNDSTTLLSMVRPSDTCVNWSASK